MKLIEVVSATRHNTTLAGIAVHFGVVEHWQAETSDPERTVTRLLVTPRQAQPVLDAVRGAVSDDADALVLVLTPEVALRREAEPQEADEAPPEPTTAEVSTREELLATVGGSSMIDSTYLLLVGLSTVVAAIGLIEDNVAVVIGAMVIAPLLGPNLAFALGTALGDARLMARSMRANAMGLGLAVVLGAIAGFAFPEAVRSGELLARTEVGPESVALALASGAAAVLSLTTGLSAVLVGVMVAVALLPPTATLGITLGAREWHLAEGALLLLLANVAAVNLAANIVFGARGVRPRRGKERARARRAMAIYSSAWVVTLSTIVLAILLRGD